MGISTAYQCDGVECAEMTHRVAKTSYPAHWPRVMLTTPDGKKHAGAFHSRLCALRWLDDLYRSEVDDDASVGDEPDLGARIPS